MHPQWLEWANRLQALAQTGLEFASNPFEVERYQAVRRVAAEMLAAGSDANVEHVLDLLQSETGYATPKVDVRGVVFQDDRVLLVKERIDGCWTLPGGWADVGATPSENVEREVYEESGYRARAVKVLAIYDRRKHGHVPPHPHHIYKIFFLCKLIGGTASQSIETDGVGFFAEHELPELSLGRVTPSQMARMFEHHRHPDWPPDFD